MPYLCLMFVPTASERVGDLFKVAQHRQTLVHPDLKKQAEFLSLAAEKSPRRKYTVLRNATAAPNIPSTSGLCLLPEPTRGQGHTKDTHTPLWSVSLWSGLTCTLTVNLTY